MKPRPDASASRPQITALDVEAVNDSPGKSRQSRPKAEANGCAAVVNAAEVYTLDELGRRLRWRRHSIRQALRAGLPTAKFGSRRYVLGADVLAFFERLRDTQTKKESN